MIKVKNEVDLARDSIGVIHNVNKNAFDEYITKRNEKLKLDTRINKIEAEMSDIKQSLSEIIRLLRG